MSSKEDHLGHQKNVIVHLFCVTVAGVTVGCRKISIYRQFPSKGCKASNSPIQTFCHPVKMRGKRNGARVLQIQNWFQEIQASRQCRGRQPRNFDFLKLTLNAHWDGLKVWRMCHPDAVLEWWKDFIEKNQMEVAHDTLKQQVWILLKGKITCVAGQLTSTTKSIGVIWDFQLHQGCSNCFRPTRSH